MYTVSQRKQTAHQTILIPDGMWNIVVEKVRYAGKAVYGNDVWLHIIHPVSRTSTFLQYHRPSAISNMKSSIFVWKVRHSSFEKKMLSQDTRTTIDRVKEWQMITYSTPRILYNYFSPVWYKIILYLKNGAFSLCVKNEAFIRCNKMTSYDTGKNFTSDLLKSLTIEKFE